MAIATATALTAASIALTAGTTAMSFAQAGKQNKLRRQAEADAMEAMAKARQKLDVNFYDQLAIKKEPYELAREAMLVQGAQSIEAAKESERGVAATAGRLQMAQQEAQGQIRSQMNKELTDMERLAIAEESRLRDMGVGLDLAEVQGAQTAAANAQKAAATATEQGMKGVANLAGQLAAQAPLFEKTAGAKQFSNLEQGYNKAAQAGTLSSSFKDASGKALPFQQAMAQMSGYGFDVSGVGGMKPFEFQDYMTRQNASSLKDMANFFINPPQQYQQYQAPMNNPARPVSTPYDIPSWFGGY